MSFKFSIAMIVFMVIAMGIPALIGAYVYRDAAGRGLNRLLWAFVAALTPSFIGLIIYLLVRSGRPDLKCPSCAADVAEHFTVCPRCGARLKASCAHCGFPAEPDWAVCPKCASPLPASDESVAAPVRRKDTALWKILLVVIALPILLLIFLVLFSFSGGKSGLLNTASVPVSDYADNAEVMAWLSVSGQDYAKAYALRYRAEQGEKKATHYLIYCPAAKQGMSVGSGHSKNLFGGFTITIDFDTFGFSGGEAMLTSASAYSDSYETLAVYLDGKKIPCEITDAQQNPGLFGLYAGDGGVLINGG